MALKFCLDVLLDNMYVWKGIRERAEEINSTKTCITNDEASSEFSASVHAICGSTALVDLDRFFNFFIYTQSVGLLVLGSARRNAAT
jgi:hypothetical protein